MGRGKHYKSPSTLKRSARRLLIHLHRMLKIKFNEENEIKDLSNTIGISKENSRSLAEKMLCTSTPLRQGIICDDCKKKCQAQHHLEIHKNEDTPDISRIGLPGE